MQSGQYYDLLRRGFIGSKPQDIEPEIGPFDFYLDAFRELDTCRPVGLVAGAIPFTAIAEYHRIWELGDFEDFFYLIRLLDRTWLKLESENLKLKGNNANSNADKTNSNKR